LDEVLDDAFSNIADMKEIAAEYGREVLKSSDKIARIICESSKK